jgi:multimeric flavodoxin WrbA
MSNLLAVFGSPRKGGNSSVLLDYFLEGAASDCSIERVYLRELNFSSCTECGRCRESGMCVLRDDMQPLYEKLLQFERIVISCPVFFLGPPAITKAFLDRFQALWIRRYVLGLKPAPGGMKKSGFLLSVCGFRGSEKIFSCNKTIVRAAISSAGYRYAGELFIPGLDSLGDIVDQEGVRERAIQTGKQFVR